jgi:peptidoglycan hydrolase-like protein with peptidoglycan-binding domain
MGLLANLLRSVDDLVKLGYPESVAKRIVSGELPMDFESRMRRAEVMGFDPRDVQYHGTEADITQFRPSTRGKMGSGVYTTPSQSTANTFSGYPSPYAEGGNVIPLLTRGDYIQNADAFDLRPNISGREGQSILNKELEGMGYAGRQAGERGSLAPERVTFDPRNVRSYLAAAFDPEYTGPSILGSAAGTAGVLGLLAAPEDAEAGVAKSAIQAAMSGVRTPQEFLSALERLGASPEQATQIAKGELSPSKIGVSSQNASLLPVIDRSDGLIDARFDPRVNSRIRNAELETGILSRGTMDDIPRVALSDLEGQRFVTSMSDRTAAGGLLESINGVNLNNLINLQGGQGFMFENPGMVWASAPNPVNQILNAAGGDNVFYLPWRMAPSGGDFATKTGETMLSYASANMSKADKKSLDKLIKEYKTTGTWDKDTQSYKGAGLQIGGWKGIDDPSSIEAWRNAPDSLRKELMNAMDVEFRDRGGLSIGEARLAVTDPDQRFAMDGGIQNVGQIFGGQPAIIGSGHPSYPAGVPGQGVGRLDQLDMSIFDLIPDARIGSDQVLVREAVDPTNPNPEALRALQMKPYSGVVTEDILKTLDDRGVNVNSINPMFAPSQDRALAAANKGLLDPLTVDEQRIQQHQRDINKQMAQIGLLADPMYEYGNIIPAKTNIVTGETSLAFPGIARDIIGGLLDLANTRRSGVYNPAAFMDVAL